jgi:hypothetical protein
MSFGPVSLLEIRFKSFDPRQTDRRVKAGIRRVCPGNLARRSFLTFIALATEVNEDGSL